MEGNMTWQDTTDCTFMSCSFAAKKHHKWVHAYQHIDKVSSGLSVYLISSFINEKLENSTSGKTPIFEKRPKQSNNKMIVVLFSCII